MRSARFLSLLLLSVLLGNCSGITQNATENGDGVPFEGAQNTQTYELQVVTLDFIIGIGFSNNGKRKVDIFDKITGEFAAGLNSNETLLEGNKVFTGSGFKVVVENFTSGEMASLLSLKFSADVDIAKVSINENYFESEIPTGVGVLVFDCAGKEIYAPFAGGDGSAESPFLICTTSQLANIGGSYRNKSFKLMANINIPANYNAPSGWLPLGAVSAPFSGVFDGGNRSVTGLKISRATTLDVGLFGITENAKIENLKIINPDIKGESNVGALVGTARGGIFSNIEVSAGTVVATNDMAGGMLGRVYSPTNNATCSYLIERTKSSAVVTAYDDYAGGLVGQINCNGTGSVVVDSSASGSVLKVAQGTGNEAAFGGLIGKMKGGKVLRSFALGNVESDSYAGGLIGNAEDVLEISNSFARGRVVAKLICGGFVGVLGGSSNTLVLNSYSASPDNSVVPTSASTHSIGGLIAWVTGSTNLSIENSFEAVWLQAGSSADRGGIVGKKDGTATINFTNVLWAISGDATTCTGWSSSQANCTGVVSDADLKDKALNPFSAWDPDLWIWDDFKDEFPVLKPL